MLRAILDEISTPPERVTLLVATGTHRPATPAELEAMFGSELLAACEVVNHRCRDASELVRLPDTGNGVPVLLNRRFLEADVRITTGFVEPHFFAGFSGGPKMVAPGLAGMETILVLHDEARIGHPSAVFGITEGNPVHDDVRAIARQVGVDFGLDVLLDGDKRITGVFGGDLLEEHAQACVRSHEEAMCPVDQPFEVVVATNSGYPLDQNLYQAVKGMSAAERIVGAGGAILCAAECRDGIPDEGAYARALRAGGTLAEVRAALAAARCAVPTTGRSRSTAASSNARASGSIRHSPRRRCGRAPRAGRGPVARLPGGARGGGGGGAARRPAARAGDDSVSALIRPPGSDEPPAALRAAVPAEAGVPSRRRHAPGQRSAGLRACGPKTDRRNRPIQEPASGSTPWDRRGKESPRPSSQSRCPER